MYSGRNLQWVQCKITQNRVLIRAAAPVESNLPDSEKKVKYLKPRDAAPVDFARVSISN